jgi:hypothetical protein
MANEALRTLLQHLRRVAERQGPGRPSFTMLQLPKDVSSNGRSRLPSGTCWCKVALGKRDLPQSRPFRICSWKRTN